MKEQSTTTDERLIVMLKDGRHSLCQLHGQAALAAYPFKKRFGCWLRLFCSGRVWMV